MEYINTILDEVSGFVWGWPMATLLLGAGLLLTLRMLFIQVRGFAHGVGIATGKYDDPLHKGQLTHFQALSAALSATIGIGNIAGVAIGIHYGGPGAIFWMWVTAFFGMAIKYAECTLAIQYRKIDPGGNVRGGPMYYIRIGMSKYFRPMAWMFAFCTAVAAFGAGNMVQSNTMALSIVDAFKIGRQKITTEQISSPDVVSQITSYNRAITDLLDGLDERQELEAQLRQARSSASSAATAIQALIDANIANLEQWQISTTESKQQLLDLRLYVFTEPDGQVSYYNESDLPVPTDQVDKVYRIVFGNAPIDLSEIALVDDKPVQTWRWVIGIVIAGLVGMVIIGGIKRIGHVASYLVPFMSVVYVLSALAVLIINFGLVVPAFKLIFYHAFNPTAVVGGSIGGATMWLTFTWGLRRGLFSNEAGQGSAAMAHSTAKVEEPVREGLVAMLGPFIDTLVICTMTALVILISGIWYEGLNSAPLTMEAFNTTLPIYGRWMVVIGVMLFAFSTVIAWSYYGEKGIEYIGGDRAKLPYKWVYIIFTLLGARFDLKAVWAYADVANGLMAVPNLIALVVLSGAVVAVTKKYMDEKARGLHVPYKELLRRQQMKQ